MDRRLIEETFPLLGIIETSKRETDQKINVVKSLHNWWGRKTLSTSRAVIYSSLIKLEKNVIAQQEKIISLSLITISDDLKKTASGLTIEPVVFKDQ